MKQKEERIEFLEAAVHELKTCLTAIIVSTDLLADELQPDENSVLGSLVTSIDRNAHSISEGLSILSEAGRLLSQDSRLHIEAVDMREVIHSTVTKVCPLIQNKQQVLTIEVPDFLPPVKVDRHCLEQILLNIIDNASKYTLAKGQMKISCKRDGNNLIVQVSDTGVGIPANEQERIFQPICRAHRADQGGLGLSITKFLVELNGGKIWLKSIVGQGSSFFFSLPVLV